MGLENDWVREIRASGDYLPDFRWRAILYHQLPADRGFAYRDSLPELRIRPGMFTTIFIVFAQLDMLVPIRNEPQEHCELLLNAWHHPLNCAPEYIAT